MSFSSGLLGGQEVQLNPLVPQLRQGLPHCLRAVAGGIVQRHHPGLALPFGRSIEQNIAHICTFPSARRPPGQGHRGGSAGDRQRGYHIHASALRIFVGDVGAGAGSAPGISGGQRGEESAFVQVQELEMAGAGFFLNACNSARATAPVPGPVCAADRTWCAGNWPPSAAGTCALCAAADADPA